MSDLFTIRVGDRIPALAYRFPFSLADATGVTFSARDSKTRQVFINRAAAVIANGTYRIDDELQTLTPENGVVFYPWAPGDTDAERDFKGLFRITWNSGLAETLPSEGYVFGSIGDNF